MQAVFDAPSAKEKNWYRSECGLEKRDARIMLKIFRGIFTAIHRKSTLHIEPEEQ